MEEEVTLAYLFHVEENVAMIVSGALFTFFMSNKGIHEAKVFISLHHNKLLVKANQHSRDID